MQILKNVFNERTINIMMDIETTGVRPGCRVLSIGLVEFDEEKTGNSLLVYPKLSDQVGIDDGNTMGWWDMQSAEAKSVFANNHILGESVEKVNSKIKSYIDDLVEARKLLNPGLDKVDVRIWGNGATFDNSIVQHMFIAKGLPIPWNTFGDRCYRTAINMLGRPDVKRNGVHHNALDDAFHQAHCLIKAIKNASE
jgi:DNA polymerase III epsilon subunit-like protein